MGLSVRALLLAAVVGACAVMPAVAAHATARAWDVPVTISGPGADAASPHMVTDGSTTTAVWELGGTRPVVQAAVSTDAGASWSAPVTLSDPGRISAYPEIATDGVTITVVWHSFIPGVADPVIQTVRSADAGLSWSSPVSISGPDAFEPQVVTDGSVITVAWYASDGVVRVIQSASSTDAGLSWSDPVTVSVDGQNANEPQLVTDGDTITAVWRRFNGSQFVIQSASSLDDGRTWSTPATLSFAHLGADRPKMVTDGTTITAVWTFDQGIWDRFVASASSTDKGLTWSTPFIVSSPFADGRKTYEPQIALDDGIITVVWRRIDSENSVWAASSADSGASFSAPVALSLPGESAAGQQVDAHGGTITAVWYGSSGTNAVIRSAFSTDEGATWSTPTALSAAGGNAGGPRVVSDGAITIALWHRFDGSNDVMQASSYGDSPTLPPNTGPELAATGPAGALGSAALALALLVAGMVVVRSSNREHRAAG